MRKNVLSMMMAVILCMSALSGCQKAPEASEDKGVLHAQGSVDREVADIAEGKAGTESGQSSGGFYEGTIGTGDNKMKISAQIPAVPANVYRLTLKPNEDLDMDALTAFLDSQGGEIEDKSQEVLDAIAESDYVNEHPNESNEIFLYSRFGDHSASQLTDGKKTAGFGYHTWADYVDYNLRDTYFRNAQDTSTLISVGGPDTGAGFSVKEAEEILLDKLEPLGITEIALGRIWLMEGNGYSYYDLNFTPSYEGIDVIYEIGAGYTLGEIYPKAAAIVTPEGVALLNMDSFCGKIAEKEPVEILSFEQVEKILEQYLDSNRIQADERIVLSNIKLEYYPVPNLAPTEGKMEYRPELELIPIWHIYMPLGDYVDGAYESDGLYNICINAVTGEIERVS